MVSINFKGFSFMKRTLAKINLFLLPCILLTQISFAQEGTKPNAVNEETEEEEEESDDLTWDSYIENSEGQSIANEITKGIRVENILDQPYE